MTNLGSGTDGYLQLTDNSTWSSAATVFDRAFPAAAGLQMTFDEYQYATSSTGIGPADGIGFFLTDGAYTLTQAGPTGGSLGYAAFNGNVPGIPHGYLGLGLDVFGNYENQPYVGPNCSPSSAFAPNSVALRGSGNGLEGYCLIDNARYANLRNAPSTAPGGAQGTPQRVTVTVSPTTSTDPYPTVTASINGVQVLQAKMTTPVPATVKLGFAASTGGGSEVHMIRNVTVSSINPLGGISLTKTVDHSSATGTTKTIFTQGDTVPYSFLVTNAGQEALSSVQVTDPKITNVTCPATTLQPADSFTCTGLYGPLTATDVASGQFENTATATGVDTDGNTQTSTSSATIPTFQSAPLSVTKHVTGTGSSAVPTGTSYTVQYSYPAGSYQPASTGPDGSANTYPGGSGTLTLTDGSTATTSTRIPTGATVALAENTPATVTGTRWGAPAFTANPVTIGADTATAVTVTNPVTADPGEVSWSKVDGSNGDLITGSQWQLTGPNGFSETVVDNGANDADSTAGRLEVQGLAWGDYSLTETKAPTGYTVNSTPFTFTISASNLAAALGAVANTVTPTPTPAPSLAPTAPSLGAAVNTGGTTASDGTAVLWAAMLVLGAAGLGVVTVLGVRQRVRGNRS